MPEDEKLAMKPAIMTHKEAAVVAHGAHTALYCLRDKANVQICIFELVNKKGKTLC